MKRPPKEYKPNPPIIKQNMELKAMCWDGLHWVTRYDFQKESISTPNFRVLVSTGQPLQENNYFESRSKQVNLVGTLGRMSWEYIPDTIPPQYRAVSWLRYDTTMISWFGYPPEWDEWTKVRDSLLSLVKQRTIDKIKSDQLNLGTVIGEFDKTTQMVLSTAKTIAKAATAIKRFDVRTAVNLLKWEINHGTYRDLIRSAKTARKKGHTGARFLADNWLAYIYGWKPLVSDCYNSLVLMHDGFRNPDSVHTVAKKANGGRSNKYGYLDKQLVLRSSWTASAEARFSIRFRVENQGIMASSSLGLLNPLSLAWELTPFSFVVDWFVDVSGYLSNLNAYSGLKFVSGTSSSRVIYNQEWIFTGRGPNGTYETNPSPVTGSLRYSNSGWEKRRTVLYDFPLETKEPTGLQSQTRQITSIALAVQQLSRVFGRK